MCVFCSTVFALTGSRRSLRSTSPARRSAFPSCGSSFPARNAGASSMPMGATRPSGNGSAACSVTLWERSVPDTASLTLCSATLGEDGMCEPPLGPLYVAAAFEEVGVEVDFRDFQLEEGAHGLSGDELARFLDGHEELVAISCFVDMLPAVVDATRQLCEARPGTLVLLGGPGPTASAVRIVEAYPWIDGVVRSEGEETAQDWIRLLRGGLDGPVPGLVYRRGDTVVDGGERARNRHLDDLPLPAYHLLDWNRYTHARIVTTRGCSYRCSFCDVTALWGNRSVYRGLDAVVEELEILR